VSLLSYNSVVRLAVVSRILHMFEFFILRTVL
jgi:hypothetical protein